MVADMSWRSGRISNPSNHTISMIDKISLATSIAEITECFSGIKELRTHLEVAAFVTQVQRQQQQFNYQLVYLRVDDRIQAVAGFRISESLA
jgi:hypothetical protein